MKKLSYISITVLLALGACTSSLYTGTEYDDVYFQSSDQPVAMADPTMIRRRIMIFIIISMLKIPWFLRNIPMRSITITRYKTIMDTITMMIIRIQED